MSDEGLVRFRERLDPIDEEISRLLGERFQICREVAEYKSEHGIPMMQPERVADVCNRYIARGADAGLPEDFSAELFELLIGATCKLEDELMDEGLAAGQDRSGGELPPGPGDPELVQSMRWAREPLPMLEECRERFGETFTLRLRHLGAWVVLSAPEDVKRVFSVDTNDLGVGVPNLALRPVLGAHSVMLSEEPEHMVQRKLMLPRFHGERMRQDAEAMTELARREVRSWPVGEPFELWPRMQALTQEVVMRAVFGDDEGRLDDLRQLLTNLTATINDDDRLWKLALFGPDWLEESPEWRAAMEPVEKAVLAEARRRAEGEDGRHDAVSILVEARHEDGSPLSEKELRDELLTLLTDGPTSSSLAWVFERLLRHPEKLARLRDELRAGEGEEYLDAVIKETLRLRPPVSVVVRRLLKPATLGGYDLPAGTLIAPCVYLVHHREDVYEKPGEFVPERFFTQRAAVPTWIPFGGGARRCLAASYAEQEMKRVLRTVLEEVDLEPVESGSERIARAAIAFSPSQHGLVVAKPRTPAYA